MNKCFIAIVLIFQSFFLYASVLAEPHLKEKAYALANYSVCETLANRNDDSVMRFYYAEMLRDGMIESERYKIDEREYIKDERQKAVITLNKINSASMNQLCQNRFDPVSRQHYKKKLNTGEKTK